MTFFSDENITDHQTFFIIECTGMRPAYLNSAPPTPQGSLFCKCKKVAAVAFPGLAGSTQALSFMFPFQISPKKGYLQYLVMLLLGT